MTASPQMGRTRTNATATKILLLLCLVAAVGATVLSVMSGIRTLSPSTVRPRAGTEGAHIFHAMAALQSVNNEPIAPTFAQHPPNLAGAIAGIVIAVALGALVVLLVWRIMRRHLFTRPLSVATIVSGCLVAASAATISFAGGPSAAPFATSLIVVGLLLIVVGLAVDRGARLQQETEGLV